MATTVRFISKKSFKEMSLKEKWKEDWFLTLSDYVYMPLVKVMLALFILSLVLASTSFGVILAKLTMAVALIGLVIMTPPGIAIVWHILRGK